MLLNRKILRGRPHHFTSEQAPNSRIIYPNTLQLTIGHSGDLEQVNGLFFSTIYKTVLL